MSAFLVRGVALRLVELSDKMQEILLGIGIEFVAGLFATIGLLSNGQRPAPGESQLPLSGGCFLGCVR